MPQFTRLAQIGLALLLSGLMLSACGTPQPTVTAATSTASATPLKATVTAQPTVTHLPTQKPTVKVSLAPTPDLKPTIDPTILPNRLMAELKLITEPGLDGHLVQHISGWAYGFAHPNGFYGSWSNYPANWLNDEHLLLLPVTGEAWGQGVYQYTQRVVLNLRTGASRLSPTGMWSESLQRLIASKDKHIVLYDLEGNVTKSFDVEGFRSYVSPTGKRLFVISKSGGTWLDLETGQQVAFSDKQRWNVFSWSPDEKRLFDDELCLTDAEAGKITCMDFKLGAFGGEGLSTIYWVAGDKVMLDWPDFFEGTPSPENQPIVLLIDPNNRTYQDLRTLIGFDKSTVCRFGPSFSPARSNFWLTCDQKSYLVDLRTFVTHTVPTESSFTSWSSDGEFTLFRQRDSKHDREPHQYNVYSTATSDLLPVASVSILSPTWSISGSQLAFLSEDRHVLGVLDAKTQTTVQVELPQPANDISWHPVDIGLALLADDGSLWWIADPTVNQVEQLTPPRPEVRDVKWSPGGNKLAFVSGADVYIITVNPP